MRWLNATKTTSKEVVEVVEVLEGDQDQVLAQVGHIMVAGPMQHLSKSEGESLPFVLLPVACFVHVARIALQIT